MKRRKNKNKKTLPAWATKIEEMIKEEEENKLFSLKNCSNRHIDSLAPELVGRVFQSGLTVVDRLHCERVSPRWKWIVGAFAWSEQRKLNSEVVLEGTSYKERRRFTSASLIPLLCNVAGPTLVELNFRSFYDQVPFNLEIAESLRFFPNLRTLNFFRINLDEFIDFLPPSLRDLQTPRGLFTVQSIRKLSMRCPNLESVPFREVVGVNLDFMNEFMGAFPRQKSLDLLFSDELPNNAIFEAIGRQKELVELLMQFKKDFDEENERAFEAMAEGCQSLQRIHFQEVERMTEQSFFHLAKIPYLTVLELHSDHFLAPFTDAVLKEIAKRGQLQRFKVQSDELTDEGIVYLVDKCKALVSLELHECPQITERSLEAVVAEVYRRHGTFPLALPTGPEDKGIFIFGCEKTQIDEDKAEEMAVGDPWLEIIPDNILGDPRSHL